MGALKLLLNEFDAIDYHLIAIHSMVEDYRLAFFINKLFEVNLSRCEFDLQVKQKKGNSSFSRFEFNEESKDLNWNLLKNKDSIEIIEVNNNKDLFSQSNIKFKSKAYFLPEFKNVDYFLKIEIAETKININKIVSKVNTIQQVTAVYEVDINKIKSKNNLIF